MDVTRNVQRNPAHSEVNATQINGIYSHTYALHFSREASLSYNDNTVLAKEMTVLLFT